MLWWWWPKKRLRPSVRLVANPNPDVGWDLRPKLGMYSRGAMCLALIMHFSKGSWLQKGARAFYLHCGSCKQAGEFAYRQQCFPLGRFVHPLVSPVMRFLQSLNCSCCYLYRAFRKAGNFLIAMNIFCTHNTTGKSYFLHLSESWCEAARKKIPRKQQDARVRKKGFLHRENHWEKVHVFFPDRHVWNGTFSGHQSLNLLM